MFCAHHQLSQVTWLKKMEYYMPFNLISNGVCVAVNNSIISLSANWSKPSIWHHVLFFLTINNAVIISSVCSTFRRKKQVVQLANKAKLWPHMQSASLVSALHTNSICYMVVYYYWLTHFHLLNSRVFTFMSCWCRCVPYVELCLCHLCVFLNAEKVPPGKNHPIYVDLFHRFLHIYDVKVISDVDEKSIRILF